VYLPSRSYVVSYVFFCHAAKASVRAKRRIDSTRSVRSLHLERVWWVRSRTSRARREGLAEHTKVISKKKNASLRFLSKLSVIIYGLPRRSTASVNRVGQRFDERTRRRSRARSTGKRHTPRMRRASHHDGRWTDARVDPGRARSSTRIGARRVRSASARAARGSASAARVRTVVKRVPRGAPPGDSSSVEKLPFRKLAREKARSTRKKHGKKSNRVRF